MDLSVVIPTRNRAALLGDLLDSLSSQNPVDFQWEVLVIDNGSTDNTAEVVKSQSEQTALPVRRILEPQPGLHNGRHRGIKEAEGRFVGLLDDDMLLEPTWVQGVRLLLEDKASAVGGRVLPQWETQPPKWLLSLENNGILAHLGLLDLGDEAKPTHRHHVYGGNGFFPKSLIFELGGFHPDSMPPELLRFRGDGETGLMDKFENAGYQAYYDPQATAYHRIGPDRMTVEYLCKRAYNEGISRSFAALRQSGGKLVTEITPKSHSDSLKQQLEDSFWKGFRFHQREVKQDSELLRYVLRERFF